MRLDNRERLCLFCTEFKWEEGCTGWSEMTPGWDARMECGKHVWKVDLIDLDTESFRALMLTAQACETYHCISWNKNER